MHVGTPELSSTPKDDSNKTYNLTTIESSRPFSSPQTMGRTIIRGSRSLRSELEMGNPDLEIQTLEAIEGELKERLANSKKRKDMSESETNRRREELNRLLQEEEQQIREIAQERDQAIKDLKNVESAYTDVQGKFERVMKTLASLKEKEHLLIERDNENMLKLKQMDETLAQFKQDAYKQVEREYQKWLSKLAEAESTNLKLKAMIRKSEMKVDKLEHELVQKEKENSELHNLCDELIQNQPARGSK